MEYFGNLIKDLVVGGKSSVYPFSDTTKVEIKKGTKVRVYKQTGSLGSLLQFYSTETGEKLGSKWADNSVYDYITKKE